MMRIVIDASAAVKWVLGETGSEAADALPDQDLMAPVIWLAESTNVLWRRARIGDITAEQANANSLSVWSRSSSPRKRGPRACPRLDPEGK
jgi:predicted nucleic acid-binding protein